MAGAAKTVGKLSGDIMGGLTESGRTNINIGTAEQMKYYRQAEDMMRGTSELGSKALKDLYGMAQGEWDYKTDPGYDFRLQEGNQAIERAAGTAAGGPGRYSGATLKALTQYGQDFASNEYGRAYGRRVGTLSPIADIGYRALEQRAGYRGGQGETAAAGRMALANIESPGSLFKGIGEGLGSFFGSKSDREATMAANVRHFSTIQAPDASGLFKGVGAALGYYYGPGSEKRRRDDAKRKKEKDRKDAKRKREKQKRERMNQSNPNKPNQD